MKYLSVLLTTFWLAWPASGVPARNGDTIPLNMNAQVVRELAELQTADGQRAYRTARTRMPIYRAMIDAELARRGLPRELIVVPFIESGFKNQSVSSLGSAGIWQIMPDTGRRLGLVVNGDTDERFDEVKATAAALRYLTDLNKSFGDWRLALRAYNEGENKLQRLIDQYRTRDAWELETASESPEHYLARFTAYAYQLKSDGLL